MQNNFKAICLKRAKVILIVISSTATLLAAGMLSIVILVDPNHYKHLVADVIEKTTGAKLEVGKVHWGVTPNLGLVAESIVLNTQTPLVRRPLLSVNKATCTLKIKSLFHGGIKIDTLDLEGVNLSLITDEGQNNWTFKQIVSHTRQEIQQRNNLMQLSRLSLKQTNLSYINLATHSIINIPNINLKLKSNDSDYPLTYLPATNTISLNNVSYSLNNLVNGHISFNYAAGKYTGTINSNRFGINLLLKSLGLPIKKQFIAAPWQDFGFNLNFNGTSHSLKLTNSNFMLAKSKARLNLNAHSLAPFNAENQLFIDKMDLASFISLNGYHLQLTSVQMSGNLNIDKQTTAYQNLHIGNLTLYGYNLHRLSMQIGNIVGDPSKFLNIPDRINQIKLSIAAVNYKGSKDLNSASNLGSLNSTAMTYQNGVWVTPQISLYGPDLHANAFGRLNHKRNYMDYQVNTRFVAELNTLTSKIIYPITVSGPINNPNMSINWDSITRQLSTNVTHTITNTGRTVKKAADSALHKTDSTIRKISNTVKGWF